MKRTILLLLMGQTICIATRAQTVNYGPFSGTQGAKSSYFGYFAGSLSTSSSTGNSFFGHQSGFMTQGHDNVGFGTQTLFSNTSGSANSATGFKALFTNTSGSNNTANGFLTLHKNQSGSDNTGLGNYALHSNSIGVANTATGMFSLYLNTFGSANTANGYKSLYSTTSGTGNTANGVEALYSNTVGHHNTANGGKALYLNVSGDLNTATGHKAAYSNSRGKENTANGYQALYSNEVGSYNSAFGAYAGTGGAFANNIENTTALGYQATTTASNSVRIGNINVGSIGGAVGWSILSDARFKRNIREDISGLDFVNQLRPVSYELDKAAINKFLRIPDSLAQQSVAKKAPVRESGFIAQEVEAIVKKTGAVFSGVEVPQNERDHYSIRYAEFVVPLVKAVQELSAKVNEQEKKSEEQQLEISALKEKLGVYEGNPNGDINNNMRVALFQNTPNPFSSDTEIKMALPETTRHASLIIYNMEGKQLKNVQVNDRGNAAIKIFGSEFSAGIYLYALIVDGKVVDTKRLILTK